MTSSNGWPIPYVISRWWLERSCKYNSFLTGWLVCWLLVVSVHWPYFIRCLWQLPITIFDSLCVQTEQIWIIFQVTINNAIQFTLLRFLMVPSSFAWRILNIFSLRHTNFPLSIHATKLCNKWKILYISHRNYVKLIKDILPDSETTWLEGN